ncbi:p-loop containing nucleoside triphosphate hydrolase protein [Chrysochromulina tobinii]|uniref:p-loop containing nucleoside triphosphate hydrolase protein n=1 Tax=Chrysochromulina tobinii TaxID=1460289 RepID=A0A0M0JK87_9EUKA|nr:p-loop containing nucleoside triphosphate hydrolase protein [Chrysochromulina tobinii]|eukprot:KOO26757.1 p-loop containing nucleoside triphosphate hydrolase protein [Chrysochromulina sp. CCMP291]
MEPTQSKATSAGAISLTRCAFSYHYDGRAPVFTDVDLDVPRGARVVLVGANGAGKSTLLRIIGGRRKRSAGDAHVFGEDAFEHTALTLRVNLVTADWEDSLTLPVRQIVTAAVAAASASAARVAQLLDVLGLAPLLTAELHALSDGQRRRVQLFCKLLPERELILLDEATNSLDVLSRAALLAFLRTEAEARGATVIFCTHIFDGLDGWATSV